MCGRLVRCVGPYWLDLHVCVCCAHISRLTLCIISGVCYENMEMQRNNACDRIESIYLRRYSCNVHMIRSACLCTQHIHFAPKFVGKLHSINFGLILPSLRPSSCEPGLIQLNFGQLLFCEFQAFLSTSFWCVLMLFQRYPIWIHIIILFIPHFFVELQPQNSITFRRSHDIEITIREIKRFSLVYMRLRHIRIGNGSDAPNKIHHVHVSTICMFAPHSFHFNSFETHIRLHVWDVTVCWTWCRMLIFALLLQTNSSFTLTFLALALFIRSTGGWLQSRGDFRNWFWNQSDIKWCSLTHEQAWASALFEMQNRLLAQPTLMRLTFPLYTD